MVKSSPNLINQEITTISGIGPALSAKFFKLGIKTIHDLWWHLPYRYQDFSKIVTIKNLVANQEVTIKGKIQIIATRRARFKRRLSITEALITDNTATIKAIWFNQPYISTTLKQGDLIYLAGKVTNSNFGLQLEQPAYEKIEQAGVNTGRLVPFYHLVTGLSNHLIRKTLNRIIKTNQEINDWLPNIISKLAQLPSLSTAILNLHFPKDKTSLIEARKRLAFNELYLINLQTKLARQASLKNPAPVINFSEQTKDFVNSLPWQLTNDQKISAWQIIKDLSKPTPMYRLLQGDVGSGKTIVAGIAAFNVIQAGRQVALLAPTEILAKQHFDTLNSLLTKTNIKIGLYTQGFKLMGDKKIPPKEFQKAVTENKINLLVGTHALLEKNINFNRLGLFIIDEQHRFGVKQRQLLSDQPQTTPHLLSLTATPIPRSLAMSIFGDLDISVIKSMPKNRKKIITKIFSNQNRHEAYKLITQEISAGHRIFIICPLIEENDEMGVKAVMTEHARLQSDIFKNIKIGLLHGKLSSQNKAEVMSKFKNGETPILVATSVIEVGVDIPQATVMVIEGADRFGIAQLHQFRGRVGRSDLQSYCFLFTDNDKSSPRLEALVKYHNGFDLAEFDLKTRGPGSLLGEIQSGFGELKFADLADINLLSLVRQMTHKTLEIDPELKKFTELRAIINSQNTHPE